MIQKDFWRNSVIAVIGGGSWGTILADMASQNCREVRMWMRDPGVAMTINGSRVNQRYAPELRLRENVLAYTSWERLFEGEPHAVIWVLPSSVCREMAKQVAKHFRGHELIIHATKGVEAHSMKRISEVLAEEIPCHRIGVMSGPNLADEIARKEPAAAVVASRFNEVCEAGQALFSGERFRVYRDSDVIGVEWAGTLKNIFAIAAGALDAMTLGWNSRSMLIARGLAEMVRFGVLMGAQQETFLGLAGVGDLIATCCSPLSRNYRVGWRLAQHENLSKVLRELGGVAEGVKATEIVREFALKRGVSMPITEGVYRLLEGSIQAKEVLHELMIRPLN